MMENLKKQIPNIPGRISDDFIRQYFHKDTAVSLQTERSQD